MGAGLAPVGVPPRAAAEITAPMVVVSLNSAMVLSARLRLNAKVETARVECAAPAVRPTVVAFAQAWRLIPRTAERAAINVQAPLARMDPFFLRLPATGPERARPQRLPRVLQINARTARSVATAPQPPGSRRPTSVQNIRPFACSQGPPTPPTCPTPFPI